MKEFLIFNLLRPLLERVGTMFAAYLIARGLDGDQVAQFVNSVFAALLMGLDLVVSAIIRKSDAGDR